MYFQWAATALRHSRLLLQHRRFGRVFAEDVFDLRLFNQCFALFDVLHQRVLDFAFVAPLFVDAAEAPFAFVGQRDEFVGIRFEQFARAQLHVLDEFLDGDAGVPPARFRQAGRLRYGPV